MRKVSLVQEFRGLSSKEKFEKYRSLWHLAKNYQIQTDFPMHLDIELAGVCNLKCSACFQNGLIEEKLGLMDENLFKRIILEGVPKGLCAIKLQIRGESLLHPKVFELIRFAKDEGVMDVQLTTNGTLLNEETSLKLIHSGLDAIIFSVDAHHGTSFQGKFKKRAYNSVEDEISRFLQLRKMEKQKRPWVRLRSSIPSMTPEDFESTKRSLDERFPDADLTIVGKMFNFKDDEDAYPQLRELYEFEPCEYLMHRLAVFWDGEVTTCCMDYNHVFDLGNAKHSGIETIWDSKKLNEMRRKHLAEERASVPICKHCYKNTKCKNAGEVTDTTPRHFKDHIQKEKSLT